MSSKKDDKGTCELNKHDISLINEDSEFHEQEGITFSMLLKVRCYVQMTIISFIKIINFVTTGVKMYKTLWTYSMYIIIIPDISRYFLIHIGELKFSNSCLFLFREFVLKFY